MSLIWYFLLLIICWVTTLSLDKIYALSFTATCTTTSTTKGNIGLLKRTAVTTTTNRSTNRSRRRNNNNNINNICLPLRRLQRRSHFGNSLTRNILNLSSGDNDNNNNKFISSSKRERREEDKRRQRRKDENIPGKTSAIPGMIDYQINPKSTEQQWLQQATKIEQQIHHYTNVGMDALKSYKLDDANDAFDNVFHIKPNAYLWQAGICKFFLGELKDASTIFVNSCQIYESKFSSPASEERIWRDACELKYMYCILTDDERKDLMSLSTTTSSTKEESRKKGGGKESTTSNKKDDKNNKVRFLTQIPNKSDMFDNNNGEDLSPDDYFMINEMKETRKVLRITRELFTASLEDDHITVLLSIAKLRSICGNNNNNNNNINNNLRPDIKMWKLSSWYYLGLYYDCMDDVDEAKECFKNAILLCPNSNGGDLIHTLPTLHMIARDWYDEILDEFDEFDDDENDNSSEEKKDNVSNNKGGAGKQKEENKEKERQQVSSSSSSSSTSKFFKDKPDNRPSVAEQKEETNIIMIHSIRTSVDKLSLTQIKSALKARGSKPYGSKEELGNKLFESLLKDLEL